MYLRNWRKIVVEYRKYGEEETLERELEVG
jgi:hypothetical protein